MERLRILMSGMIAGDAHQGGATWAVMQYVLGLRALGHDVWLVEPVRRLSPISERYFRAVAGAFGIADRAALLVAEDARTAGVPYPELVQAAERADVLLNVSGMLRDPALVGPPPIRVYLDLDPAFNQLWHAVEGIDMGLDAHNRFATVGLELGRADCPVPTCGRDWITTLPPVHLPSWDRAEQPPSVPFTTVGNWRAYGSIEWDGLHLGQKAHSLRDLLALPSRTSEDLLLAMAIHPDERRDLDALAAHGWRLADPQQAAGTPSAYRDFIRASKGELGVAKSGYVTARCGWFSDRSACYLASGRPVVAQETGFSRHLPTGDGLLAFATVDEAAAALDDVGRRYAQHAAAARDVATQLLDAAVVLPALLERVA